MICRAKRLSCPTLQIVSRLDINMITMVTILARPLIYTACNKHGSNNSPVPPQKFRDIIGDSDQVRSRINNIMDAMTWQMWCHIRIHDSVNYNFFSSYSSINTTLISWRKVSFPSFFHRQNYHLTNQNSKVIQTLTSSLPFLVVKHSTGLLSSQIQIVDLANPVGRRSHSDSSVNGNKPGGLKTAAIK